LGSGKRRWRPKVFEKNRSVALGHVFASKANRWREGQRNSDSAEFVQALCLEAIYQIAVLAAWLN
jgi:hypothetical protein